MISKFQKGSGAFKCEGCGRQTRHTGVQSSGSKTCPDCFELAGIYNVHQDGGDLQPYKAEIIERCARIEEKGGTLDDDARELLQLVGAGGTLRAALQEIAKDADALSWQEIREIAQEALDAERRAIGGKS